MVEIRVGRADVAREARIGRPGCSAGGGDIKKRGLGAAVEVEAGVELPRTGDPLRPVADAVRRAVLDRRAARQRGFGVVVEVLGRAACRQVQRLVAAVVRIDDHFTVPVVADDAPLGRRRTGRVRLERSVLDQFRGRAPGVRDDADVVQQHFPGLQESQHELLPLSVGADGAGLGRYRVAVGPPGGAAALVAGGPGFRAGVVGARVAQFQARPIAVGIVRPRPVVVVPDDVGHIARCVAQFDPFPGVGEVLPVLSNQVRQAGVDGQHGGGVVGDDEKTTGRQHRPVREVEGDTVAQAPVREVDGAGAPVVQFDPRRVRFIVGIEGRGGVIHDLVDDDVLVEGEAIGLSRCRCERECPFACTGRVSSAEPVVHHGGIDHSSRGAQKQLIAGHGVCAQHGLGHDQCAVGRHHFRCEYVAACCRTVDGQDVVGHRKRCERGVDEFDPEAVGQGGRRFVDGEADGDGRYVDRSRRSADVGAPCPARGIGAVAVGVGLAERDTGSVGRDGPVVRVAVVDDIHQPAAVVTQSQFLARVAEPPFERAEDIGESVLGGDVVGGERDDAEATGRDEDTVGYVILHPSPQPPARDVEVVGELVVQLDPFQGRLVRGGVVHDLVEDYAGAREGGEGGEQGERQHVRHVRGSFEQGDFLRRVGRAALYAARQNPSCVGV